MTRKLAGSLTVAMLCVVVTVASGATRGGGARGGQSAANRKPPGGAWSEYNPGGRHGGEMSEGAHNQSGAQSAAAGHATGNRNASQATGAQGAAAEHHNAPSASGAEGAAASHAVSENNAPQATGAQGAAAGAAAANRNAPTASGAQGAAAGYAAGQNNAPQVSGAQGAAAGAAVANNNAPAASGAQGAAAGYAAGQNNAPQGSGAQGVVAGVAAANNNAPASPNTQDAAAGLAAVRSSANHQGMYGAVWQSDHPNAWNGANLAAGAAWAPVTWTAVVGHCGYDNHPPVQYNYGANVTCVGGNVVVDGQPAGTAEVFSQEAADIAESGTDTATTAADQWLPLGVFALVRNEHQHPQLIMQLAVNQHGVLRGNYTDQVTDTTTPIQGGVDGPTKRAAWTVGDNRYVVMEAGLSNLTQNEVPALIHKNGATQRWILVRLPEPAPSGSAATPAAAPQ